MYASNKLYSMYASNKLYSGDVANLEEAMRLFRQALAFEAHDMRNICEPGDDFPDRLKAEADEASRLIAEYESEVKAVERALVARWAKSESKIARQIAEAAQSEDWSMLAV